MNNQTPPRWTDLTDLAKQFSTLETGLLERKTIFEKIALSATAGDKDIETANSVVAQINDILNDNKAVITKVKQAVSKKTQNGLKNRATVKPADGQEYMSYMIDIENRFNATGAFDEMLLQKLHTVVTGEKDE